MKKGLFVYRHISSIIGATGTVAELTLSLLDLTLAAYNTQGREEPENMNRSGGKIKVLCEVIFHNFDDNVDDDISV